MKSYYGEETKKALANFPLSYPRASLSFMYAIAEIKLATARANYATGLLDKERFMAISKATQEILGSKFDDQFVTPGIQGGAGTSMHMNVNEVIACRATEIIQKENVIVDAYDHVNLGQSTNDVNPSALRLVCLRSLPRIVQSIRQLVATWKDQAARYGKSPKLGRTHLQDAIPTTVGEIFLSYAATMERHINVIDACTSSLYELNLGGTAIGNSLNASPAFIKETYEELQKITNLNVKPAKNLMSLTSSQTDFCRVSHALVLFFVDLSKIASDIRLLSSGPNGGLGEVSLPALQKGSSIMPGKVNPVIPELVNQTYFRISGNNLTIEHAAHASQLELGVMFPVLADSLITSLTLGEEVTDAFRTKCVVGLVVNEKRCQQLLDVSTAYATVLTPRLGYSVMAEIVKKSYATHKSIRQLVAEAHLLTEDEIQVYFGKKTT